MISVLSEHIWRKAERSDEERSLRLLKWEQVLFTWGDKGRFTEHETELYNLYSIVQALKRSYQGPTAHERVHRLYHPFLKEAQSTYG